MAAGTVVEAVVVVRVYRLHDATQPYLMIAGSVRMTAAISHFMDREIESVDALCLMPGHFGPESI